MSNNAIPLTGCVITASSWGREDMTPNNGYITVVNGETYETKTTNGNGFNLVELDVIKCSLSELRNFDTGTTTGDSEKMAIFLQNLPKSTVLIGVTSDEASEQLETSAKNALLAIGVDLNGLRRHGKVAFVAHVGRRELTVMQMGHESGENVQLVTSTRRQDCGVTALSWGFDDTTINNGYVNAGVETRTINERGFNLVEFDVSKCSLSSVRNFDTHESTEASQAMANYLKDLPASTVLIGVTADEASYRLDTVAKAALVAIGVDVTGLQHHGKVAFVAHICRPELSVMQMGPRYDTNVKISTIMEVSAGLRDCSDVRARGYTTSGVYTVYICDQAMEVYCELTATSPVGWTVFQKRKDGSVDFYRGWEQYRTGFGDLEGEFWLGNDNLHTLTSAKRYKLRIELTYFDGKTAFAEYDNFKVASLNDKYKLTSLGTYSGTAGNAMFHNSGHNFSTKDDDSTEMKWAAKHKAAWWYYCNRLTPANDDSVSMSNLNGLYYETPTGSEDGVKWYHWKQSKMQIKQSVMKITPFI